MLNLVGSAITGLVVAYTLFQPVVMRLLCLPGL